MILALLMGATAEDPAFERLFGAEPTPADPAVAQAPQPGPPEVPAWALPGGIGLAAFGGAVWMWKSRRQQAIAPLTVLQRQSIGDRSSLVLIEVVTGDGEHRRLLVGTGAGVPALVADLGDGFDDRSVDARAVASATASNVAEEVLRERRTHGNLLAVAGDDE